MTANRPTVEAIRDAWAAFAWNLDVTEDEARAQFNAWLAETRAAAWDEGRDSFGLDFLKPLREDGTRPQTPNPYRTEATA